MMKNRPALRTYLWCWNTSSWQKVKISLKEKVAIMKSMGLKFFCNLVHRCQYFFHIFKITLYFYFQIPSEINQPWQTSPIEQKASPAELDQNKATINRKKTLQAFRETTKKKTGFTPPLKTDNRMTAPYPSAAATDHICRKPSIQYNDDRQFQTHTLLPQPCQV